MRYAYNQTENTVTDNSDELPHDPVQLRLLLLKLFAASKSWDAVIQIIMEAFGLDRSAARKLILEALGADAPEGIEFDLIVPNIEPEESFSF